MSFSRRVGGKILERSRRSARINTSSTPTCCRRETNEADMNRIKSFFLLGWMLCGIAAFAQIKGFTVEEKPADILEKQAGVGERYALLIGVSKYANASISLNY